MQLYVDFVLAFRDSWTRSILRIRRHSSDPETSAEHWPAAKVYRSLPKQINAPQRFLKLQALASPAKVLTL